MRLLGVVTVLLALPPLLLASTRRSGMATSGLLVPNALALLSLLVPAVLLVMPTRPVVLLRLLVGSGAVVLGLVLSVPLVRVVAPLVGVAGLGARSLAELPTAGLLLLVVSAGGVLPVVSLGLVTHVLIPVVAARAMLLPFPLLPVVRRV